MSSIFEFPLSKLGHVEISITISLSNFAYLPDEDGKKIDVKNEDKDEKFERMTLIFEFSISKFGFMTILMKI